VTADVQRREKNALETRAGPTFRSSASSGGGKREAEDVGRGRIETSSGGSLNVGNAIGCIQLETSG
jgi:hypothetical protein